MSQDNVDEYRSFNVHKSRYISIDAEILNQMVGSVALYLDGQQIRKARIDNSSVEFPRIGRGEDLEGRELAVLAFVTDTNPDVDRIPVNVTITGGVDRKNSDEAKLLKVKTDDRKTYSLIVRWKLT